MMEMSDHPVTKQYFDFADRMPYGGYGDGFGGGSDESSSAVPNTVQTAGLFSEVAPLVESAATSVEQPASGNTGKKKGALASVVTALGVGSGLLTSMIPV